MSQVGETNWPSEGFVGNDDKSVTTQADDDSLFDILPFEELNDEIDGSHVDAGDTVNTDETVNVVGKDAAISTTLELMSLGRSRLRKLPDMQCAVDWIMGRNLVTNRTVQLAEPPAKTIKKSEEVKTGLEQEIKRKIERKIRPPKLIDDDFLDIGDVQDICPACTTPYCTAIDSLPFKGSLRLSYNDPETHTWSIGDKYILTESIDDEGPEQIHVPLVRATQLFKRSKVPVPNVLAGWKESGRIITISEKAEGERLYDIWWDLDQDQREAIAKEVARYIGRWRACVADSISSLSGGPVWGHDHLFGTRHSGFGPFANDEQLWEAMHEKLKERNVHEIVIQTLKDYMPESAPCLLTHGDVSSYNVVIRDGKVSAILGLERAARLPAWAEYVAAHFCCCKEDEQWKAMLTRHMTRYPRTRDWWALWASATTNGSGKRVVAKLVARCRRWEKSPREKRAYEFDADEDEWRRDEDDEEGKNNFQYPPKSFLSELMPGLDLRHNTWEEEGGGGGGGGAKGKRRSRAEYEYALQQKKKHLMKPRRYTELLEDPDWQEPVGSQSGDSDIIVPLNDFALSEIERRMEAERARIKEQEAADGSPAVPRRISIERWLAESVRGRRAIRPLLAKLTTDFKGEVPIVSPTKSPPWRERQRSFERPQNNNAPRGLRPFSLTQSGDVTEAAKKSLREIGERQERLEEHEESDSRERALRSLEGGSGGDNVNAAAAAAIAIAGIPVDKTPEDKAMARHSSPAQHSGKRASIFPERTRPGSLYLAVATAGAEGRSRRYRRSRSEERAGEVVEEQRQGENTTITDQPPPRARSQSVMPQSAGAGVGASGGTQPGHMVHDPSVG
ncbi:uncharacterized protein GGS22DRAFT_175411 [Annulohypoxylon maeteangense]|uniref:uncharacterized protein n=1 Tax=Annulohypoxylon maeteangense TaxID=1927788 RepID=UPI00200737CD|nr:uncharacterized protein GGS22DRAFT_175411 [Annulohypoxylon maeteangense]KAI0880350.1 hypothetical protein GGS22DRAFT_175411 [Annulohypoxylon maeteangense]